MTWVLVACIGYIALQLTALVLDIGCPCPWECR